MKILIDYLQITRLFYISNKKIYINYREDNYNYPNIRCKHRIYNNITFNINLN
jgi:hypothetical protein